MWQGLDQQNVYIPFHVFMASWICLYYGHFIQKTSLKIYTKTITRVWEPLDRRGWPGWGREVQLPMGQPAGGGHSRHPELPTPGTVSGKQEPCSKQLCPPPSCWERSWAPGRLLWEGSLESLPALTLCTHLGLGRLTRRKPEAQQTAREGAWWRLPGIAHSLHCPRNA